MRLKAESGKFYSHNKKKRYNELLSKEVFSSNHLNNIPPHNFSQENICLIKN